MKKILLGFGIFLLIFYGSISFNEAVVDRIVAVINQEIITLSEVEARMGPQPKEIQSGNRLGMRERIDEVRRKILEQLIEEKLIDQEIEKSGTKVTNKEVEAALEDIKSRNAATQEDLKKALAKDGLSLEAFKKQIEKKLQRMKLINIMIKIESKIGERELRDFYQNNIDGYRSTETYQTSHILFRIPQKATLQEVREIRRRFQKVLEKIKRGEDFGEMALLYSEDASAKNRGDLGYFKKGELLPAFEKEALRLQIGEVSGIIRTDFGFHIIKLLDRKGGDPIPFEEVKEKVQADSYDKKTEKAFRQFISTLKEKSVIDIKL